MSVLDFFPTLEVKRPSASLTEEKEAAVIAGGHMHHLDLEFSNTQRGKLHAVLGGLSLLRWVLQEVKEGFWGARFSVKVLVFGCPRCALVGF